MFPRILIFCAVVSACIAGEPKPETFDAAKLKQWASELGADDFDKRQAAQSNLSRAGDQARDVLENAKKNGDIEIASRAEQLLDVLYACDSRQQEFKWFQTHFGSLFGSDLKSAPVVVAINAEPSPGSDAEKALEWLAKTQEPDGRWNSVKHGAAKNADIEQSALALIAFLGAGHTEKVGQYKANVKLAVQFLREHTGEDGGVRVKPGAEVDGITQALAGLALAESSGMANLAETKQLAQKVLDYAVGSHQSRNGEKLSGFGRLAKSEKPDLFTTMLFTMQMKSAKVAGLKVPAEAFDGVIEFLDTLDQSEKGFALAAAEKPSARGTVAGLLCRQFLGWKKDDLAPQAAKFLKKYGTPAEGGSDNFFDWIGELVLFQQGGDLWTSFNNGARRRIAFAQSTEGEKSGSIEPPFQHIGILSLEFHVDKLSRPLL